MWERRDPGSTSERAHGSARGTMARGLPIGAAAAVALGLALAAGVPGCDGTTGSGRKVTVFVIDSASGLTPESQKGLSLFKDISHGEIVTALVREAGRPDKLFFHDVDDASGKINHRKYLKTLADIASYVRLHPSEDVMINISFGGPRVDLAEAFLIGQLIKHQAIVVAAAGNEGWETKTYPAAYRGVVAVAACDGDRKTPYSNYGDHVFIATEGHYDRAEEIPTFAGVQRRKIRVAGTSFAAPRVAGTIAYILSKNAEITHADVLGILKKTSTPLRLQNRTWSFGRLETGDAYDLAIPGRKSWKWVVGIALCAVGCVVGVCLVMLAVSLAAAQPGTWATKILKPFVAAMILGALFLGILVSSGGIRLSREDYAAIAKVVKKMLPWLGLGLAGAIGVVVLRKLAARVRVVLGKLAAWVRDSMKISAIEKRPEERLKRNVPYLLGRLGTRRHHNRVLSLLVRSDLICFEPPIKILCDHGVFDRLSAEERVKIGSVVGKLSGPELTRILDGIGPWSLIRLEAALAEIETLSGHTQPALVTIRQMLRDYETKADARLHASPVAQKPDESKLARKPAAVGPERARGPGSAGAEHIKVYVAGHGTRYHRAFCPYLGRSENVTELTVTEARGRGYTPCRACEPPA